MKFTDKVKSATKLIKWAVAKYPRLAVACSFGKDSMVVLHLCLQVKPDIEVFSVMTPFKFPETFKYKDTITRKFGLNIKTYMQNNNTPLYETDVEKCCDFYKVEPTKWALKDKDAWITGLRRTEGKTRTDYDFVEEKGGLLKINPILDFTELDVWRYLALNQIPVNPLYAQGYRSLGCMPCSNVESDETDTERQGRWSGTSKCGGECGIHTKTLK